MEDIYENFWNAFQEQTDCPENVTYKRCCYFGGNEDESVDEVHRLMRGQKTAVSHCIPYYIKNHMALPQIGDYTMVTDFIGNPGCIYLTKDVTLAPISEISEDLAKKELPEKTYEEWVQWRQSENQNLAKRFHFPYSEDLAILIEELELVYPKVWLNQNTED